MRIFFLKVSFYNSQHISTHNCNVTLFTILGPDPEKFFMLLANSQGRRLDDQRIALPSLPGIHSGDTTSKSAAAEADARDLCNMVSRLQVGLM